MKKQSKVKSWNARSYIVTVDKDSDEAATKAARKRDQQKFPTYHGRTIERLRRGVYKVTFN